MSQEPVRSLRDQHVQSTRAALVAAGRELFGSRGFAATSVDDIAKRAAVTTGALYHHFRTKQALFESVFEDVHRDLMAASARAAGSASGMDRLLRGFESYLDQVLEPDVQRIVVVDGPAVLGLRRFAELDERQAVDAIATVLREESSVRSLDIEGAETLARLLLGALTRGGTLVATSPTPDRARDVVSQALRVLVAGLSG